MCVYMYVYIDMFWVFIGMYHLPLHPHRMVIALEDCITTCIKHLCLSFHVWTTLSHTHTHTRCKYIRVCACTCLGHQLAVTSPRADHDSKADSPSSQLLWSPSGKTKNSTYITAKEINGCNLYTLDYTGTWKLF